MAKLRKPSSDKLTSIEIRALAKAMVKTDRSAAKRLLKSLAKSVKSLLFI